VTVDPGRGTGDRESAEPSEPGDTLPDLPGWAGFATLGMTIAICVAVGVGIGLWVDARWGLSPWGLLAGLVLGTGLAVMSVVKLVRRWL
jgi:ATP synthase protein I